MFIVPSSVIGVSIDVYSSGRRLASERSRLGRFLGDSLWLPRPGFPSPHKVPAQSTTTRGQGKEGFFFRTRMTWSGIVH